MKRYTNKHKIALPMALWLTRDTYDYSSDPQYVSATGLLDPIRRTILARRETNKSLPDVSDFIASRTGTAVHDSFEKAWVQSHKTGLEALGYPQGIIDRILVNPEPEDLKEDTIAIYFEKRVVKEIAGFKVGGKFDMVADGVLNDLKTTSTYGYMKDTNNEKHKLQGSIYRWLNPDIVTYDYINIQYLFTDWSKASYIQQKDKGYPPLKIAQKRIPLLSLDLTEKFIIQKLELIEKLMSVPENKLPECTDEELWRTDPVFKYYKNPEFKTRSTKNFDTLEEANNRLFKDGSIGEVVEVKGQVKACKYCPAFEHCSQKDKFIMEQSLIIED